HPVRMPYYVAMAALGSLGGCIWIYLLARKGGQAYYRKKPRNAPGKIRALMEKHPLAFVLLPAIAPFPVPFKPFVIAQGVFQVPFAIFVTGTLVGRATLFFFEGCLGARYGVAARQFLANEKWVTVVLVLGLVLVFLMIRRAAVFRPSQCSEKD